MSEHRTIFDGQCLCGDIRIRVTGAPAASGICHCASCRSWHAAPINAWAIWPADAVELIEGEDLLVSYDTGRSIRDWCGRCGCGMMNRKPDGQVIVYADVLAGAGYVHEPICHVHCEESVFDVQDGLPKYLDLPRVWGGSGKKVKEPERTGFRNGMR